jgi:putative spermidine/putrescine transport system ATP-binding protein
MNQARIEQVGTPQAVYERPLSRFAAAFLGHSNLLDGRVDPDGRFVWNGGALPLAGEHESTDAACLMVRPEAARLVPVEHALLQGRVGEVVYQGAEFKLVVDVGAPQGFMLRTPCHGPRPLPGEAVGIAWDPAHAVLLHR